MLTWRLVAQLVGREHGLDRLRAAGVVARVHLGENVAGRHAGAALQAADDPDGVVDRVLLRPPARTEVERRDPDRDCSQPDD